MSELRDSQVVENITLTQIRDQEEDQDILGGDGVDQSQIAMGDQFKALLKHLNQKSARTPDEEDEESEKSQVDGEELQVGSEKIVSCSEMSEGEQDDEQADIRQALQNLDGHINDTALESRNKSKGQDSPEIVKLESDLPSPVDGDQISETSEQRAIKQKLTDPKLAVDVEKVILLQNQFNAQNSKG